MAKKKNKKVVRYRRPLNINVGMIIFALIFLYMAFYLYTYLRRDKVEFYEVVEGSIVNDTRHTGIIFRTEEPKYTDRAGNINFYLREGKRAAVGTRVYSIDETGTLSALLAEKTDGSVALSKENLASLKKQLSSFSQTFTNEDFREVYDTKNTLDAEVLEYVSVDTLKNLDSAVSELGGNFTQVRADQSGIVSYSVDSMETLTPNQVTADMFDKSSYKKSSVRSGQLVETGAPAYKIITSEDWSIVFPMSEQELTTYNGKTSLAVKFNGRDLETSGAFSTVTGGDGKTYGKLDFSKYMEQFVSDRYVDFEIVTDEVRGLKIPRSSVTDVTFYVIPKDYYVSAKKDSSDSSSVSQSGFRKETYADGKTVGVITSCTIYYADDEYYYVDAGENSELKAGDFLTKDDSEERYQIGMTQTVQGVYNINRGYAVFRRIEILSSNDEYYTIKKGTDYGLSVYDHIVLDANAVTGNGMIVYQ